MRLLLYDATEDDAPWLSTVWAAGSYISGADRVVACTRWRDGLDAIDMALDALAPDEPLEIPVFGHGYTAASLIAGEALDPNDLRAARRGRRLAPGSWMWCRQCDTAQGARGQRYVERLVDALGADVLAHTRIVSGVQVSMLGRTVMIPTPWQAGLYALRPGEEAWWPATDKGGSGPTSPRKVLATTMEPPGWAWKGGR